MPHFTGNSNFCFDDFEDRDRLGVVHAHEGLVDDRLELRDHALLDPLLEERHVVGALVEHRLQDVLEQRSASVASSERSANAISGSIIQNSARWRLVLEFSARNVGPNV